MPKLKLTFAERINLQKITELERLIDYFGNASVAARELGFSRMTVQQWIYRKGVSKKGAMKAELYDNVYFKKEDIRPDVMDW